MKWYHRNKTKQGNSPSHYYIRLTTVIRKVMHHQLPKYFTIIQLPIRWEALVTARIWRTFPSNWEILCYVSTHRWGLQHCCKEVQLTYCWINKFMWQLDGNTWFYSPFGFHRKPVQGWGMNQGSLCTSRPWRYASKQGKVDTYS